MNVLHKTRLLSSALLAFIISAIFTLPILAEVVTISQQTLLDKQAANAPLLIVDVRTPEEYASGHVPNAINIPHTLIKQQLPIIKQASKEGKEIVVYCHSGRRAGHVEEILEDQGVSQLRHLEGDIIAWHSNNRPLEH